MDIKTLHSNILTALPSDPITQAHVSDTTESQWSVDESGFLWLNQCIYILDIEDLCLRVLQNKHDHPISGHYGQNQTMDLIRHEYTWPGIWTMVKDYIQSCTTCARSKALHHHPYGLLKQLPIPEKPWNSISMDFIEQLPLSSSFTAILVIIDWLSKQSIFIPTHNTITSPELTKLFLLHMFSMHGVLAHVTSNQGTEFMYHFFQSLGKALDMCLHFTSSYHPEGDGQTERINQTLKQYLQSYCNYQQDNWSELLPLAEFMYNNAPSATTRVSPFFANKSYHPNISVYPECDMTSAWAHGYAVDLDSLHQYLHEEMANAQLHYQGLADAKRSLALDFKVSDQVYVKAKYFQLTRPSKKLLEKNLGPYPIIAQVGSLSFTLRLPESMQPFPIPSPTRLSHLHLQWKLMVNWSSRSPRSLTPKLTVNTKLANSCTWSGGPGMKALTKKLCGYSPLNLAMQLNSLTNIIPDTWINPAPWPLPNSGTIPSQNSHVRI